MSTAEFERDSKDPRYANVARRMWTDAGFANLSAAKPNAQTLLIRLLTGPEGGSIPGVIACGEAALAEALGWPLAGFRKAFAELEAHGMAVADWKARFVFLPNAAKHRQNQPTSPNVIRSWRRWWAELPECDLKIEAHHTLRAMVEGIGDGKTEEWLEAFDKSCPEPLPKSSGKPFAKSSPKSSPKTIGNQRSEIRDQKSGGGDRAPRGTRLSDEWEPSPDTLDRFRTKEHIDASLRVEQFKNHWLTSTRSNAVKTQWERAFINWVLKDIEDGKCPKIPDELPILRLPNRDELLRQDLENAADMSGFSLGATP